MSTMPLWQNRIINCMILYFNHIIHIDDFPLNGHPPSFTLYCLSQQTDLSSHPSVEMRSCALVIVNSDLLISLVFHQGQ